jgi:hypothetical protein
MKMKTIFRLLLPVFLGSTGINLLHAQWVQTGLIYTDVLALAVSDTNLFAGTKDSIFLSTDNTRRFAAVLVCPMPIQANLRHQSVAGNHGLSFNDNGKLDMVRSN